MYNFTDKVALVTGGGQGIGLAYIRELLVIGVVGVSLVDINVEQGQKSAKILNQEFGGNKVLFVRADVTKANQLEDAFKTSLSHWKNLDIVINNAGIINENKWKSTILVNCVGTDRGTRLAFKYLSKNNGGRGGIIINTASITGIDPLFFAPTYSATKSFIIALGRALGTQPYFDYTGVKVITICPGATDTPLFRSILDATSLSISPYIKELAVEGLANLTIQTTEQLAKGMITAIKNGSNGSVWVIEGTECPYEIAFPERIAMRAA